MISQLRHTLKELGLRLKQARISRNYTVKEMALKANTSDKTYRRVEQGEPSVAIKHFVMAAQLLDLDFTKSMAELIQVRKKRVRKIPRIGKDEVDF